MSPKNQDLPKFISGKQKCSTCLEMLVNLISFYIHIIKTENILQLF